MNVLRIDACSLGVFKTFDGYRAPEFLDIQTQSMSPDLLEDLPHLGLAIVGTRHPQNRSLRILARTVEKLSGSGLIIISGFARGVDSAAHELALRHGLRTIAILGCGIDVDYPKENRRLRDQILLEGGMILSSFDRGSPPLPHAFHQRNGMIAGFSKAVWVVEAAGVSGTLNTASWAQKFNRDLYATSCFPDDPFFQGNQKILSQSQPDRYPVAHPFFGPQSLACTWPEMPLNRDTQTNLNFPRCERTRLQEMVLSIQSEFGICHGIALMQADLEAGTPPSTHFRELEIEIREGRIQKHANGSLETKA
ncbi:MAG: DNA-processing protein DprA [Bdellovibrionales bacterium]|nr:DNA-processing protein DprA [Bdellovibrionales bacterium]